MRPRVRVETRGSTERMIPTPQHQHPSDPDLLGSRGGRLLLTGLGSFCVGLGVLGVAVPVLPTFPFLLLAAWCYARSSPRLHRRLLESRTFGPALRQWRETRTVSRRAKLSAVLLVVLAFGTSVVLVDVAWLRAVLLALGLILLALLCRLPSPRPCARASISQR